ncbi:MAG: lysylphosphatidylglycerol synthase transmembrane domain-containing protein [Planctomycetota bacterium]|jgi:uncharacterized membrane protein YbhN (UPF0104 family)
MTTEAPRPGLWKARLAMGLRWAGTMGLLGYLASRMDWQALARSFAGMDFRFFAASIAVFSLAQVASAIRWRALARAQGFRDPFGPFVRWYAAGMFCNLALPSSVGGDVVRAWYLSRKGTGPVLARRQAAVASVLLDRATGLGVLIGVAGVAALAAPPGLPARVTAPVWMAVTAAACGLLAWPLISIIGRKVAPRFAPLLGGVDGVLRDPVLLATTTACSVVVQMSSIAQVALVGTGLGIDLPWAFYGCVVPLVSLLTLLPVSLNGMGLREAGYVGLLSPLGVSSAQSVALSLLGFAATSLVALAGLPVLLADGMPRRDDESMGGSDEPGTEAVGDHSGEGGAGQPASAA